MKLRDMRINDEVPTEQDVNILRNQLAEVATELVSTRLEMLALRTEVANLRSRIPDTPGGP